MLFHLLRGTKNIPAESFKDVVVYWPLTGWLTGAASAALLCELSFYLGALLIVRNWIK